MIRHCQKDTKLEYIRASSLATVGQFKEKATPLAVIDYNPLNKFRINEFIPTRVEPLVRGRSILQENASY